MVEHGEAPICEGGETKGIVEEAVHEALMHRPGPGMEPMGARRSPTTFSVTRGL